MPLNSVAVNQANRRLWAAHPELAGRALTRDPADAELRREWMRYYREATQPQAPAVAAAPAPGTDLHAPAAQPVSAVQPCESQCRDESGRDCPCADMTTITLYVQQGDSPVSIVGSYLGDKLTKSTPQPNTGHAFIAVGDGPLAAQRAYGFYPVSSWFGGTGGINTNDGFFVPGRADPVTDAYDAENLHIYSHSKSFKACPAAVAALEGRIRKEIAAIQADSPGALKYDLTGTQCTTWAREHLRSLGFDDPGGFSPHGAAEAIDKLTGPP